jgi:hypothetical protein
MIKDIASEEREKLLKGMRELESYSIIADETCDSNGRALMNLILIPRVTDSSCEKLSSFLLDTIELNECNAQTVAREVVQSLNSQGLAFDKLFGFISDNASYMLSAFKTISIVCPNAIHLTCWSHIFDLVAQTFYKSFPETDKFVANMKKAFNYKRKMCRYFKQSTGHMPPKPVKTRWTSWLGAVKVHSTDFEKYKDLFENIKEDKIGKSRAFKKIYDLLNNEKLNNDMKAELEFIASIAETMISQIKSTEEMKVSVHQIYNHAIGLEKFFEAIILAMENNEDINSSEEFIVKTINAIKSAKSKLGKYLHTSKQPAYEFLSQIRIFDTKQAKNCEEFDSLELKQLNSIPKLINYLNEKDIVIRANIFQEYSKYKTFICDEEVQSNVMEFWFKHKHDLPLLSSIIIGYLSVPISGAEVERSFSCLANILTDKRRSLITDNLKDLMFLNFNSKK